jgi:flagellar hook-associated protein 2
MSTSSIDGIISGFKTSELIESLLTRESGAQSQIQARKDTTDSMVSALQSLNTKVALLAEAATSAAKGTGWTSVKATSSDSTVTAAVGSTAQVGSLRFRVKAVAQSQVTLIALPTDFSMDGPVLKISRGDDVISIHASGGSVGDIVAAVNAAGIDVHATSVYLNDDDAGNPVYGIQISGDDSGEEIAFQFSYTNNAGEDVPVGVNVREAEDAKITLYPGTAFEHDVTSSSNTFQTLLTGVDVTVSQVTPSDFEDVELVVNRDSSAAEDTANSLVNNLNLVLTEITSQTTAKSSTNDEGDSILVGGTLTGSSAVRELQFGLMAAAGAAANGHSVAEFGISITRDGTFEIDDELFSQALEANPDDVKAALAAFGQAVADVASAASDKENGSLSLAIEENEGVSNDLNDQLEAWEERLEMRRESLLRQFTAMEDALSELQSQSSFLTAYLMADTNQTSSSDD